MHVLASEQTVIKNFDPTRTYTYVDRRDQICTHQLKAVYVVNCVALNSGNIFVAVFEIRQSQLILRYFLLCQLAESLHQNIAIICCSIS